MLLLLLLLLFLFFLFFYFWAKHDSFVVYLKNGLIQNCLFQIRFFAWKLSLWKTIFDSLLVYNLFKIFWNLKKHLEVVFCKNDFYIIFFEITRESQKTAFVQIFLKFETRKNCLYKRWFSFKIFWNLKKHLKVVFCKCDFYIIFFEITCENCLYKRRLLFKFFWNLKKHMKDDFLKKKSEIVFLKDDFHGKDRH